MPIEELSNGQPTSRYDPTQEYLTAGYFSNFGYGTDDILASSNDDVIAAYGSQLYEEMMKDPKVSKCINVLKIYTLGDGVELAPCLGENDPNYYTALAIEQFCSQALKSLEKPLRDTIEAMLDALIYGHKIAEITYEFRELPEVDFAVRGKRPASAVTKTANYLLPKSVKVKPFGTARFVVSKTYSILGVIGNNLLVKNKLKLIDKRKINSAAISEKSDGIHINVDGKDHKFLDRDKFMILTVRGKDEDPRGQSLLRAAFNPWHVKEQIYPEYMRFMLVCAIPIIVGFTPKEEPGTIGADIVRNADGSPVMQDGQMVRVNPVAALRAALLEARNATALALKGGSDIKTITNNGDGGVFTKAIETFNEEIETAILLQTLATSESRYQTRAASQTHMTVLDQLVWSLKGKVCDMVANDLVKKIIKLNFGEWALKFTPVVSLGDTERRDFSVDAAAVAALYASGFISEDQKRHYDLILGAPPRDENYNPFRRISPTESLQIAKSVYEQEKLQTEVEINKERANTERVKQIEALAALTAVEGMSSDNLSKINSLIDDLIADAKDQIKNAAPNMILEGLTEASKRSEWITGRPSDDISDLGKLPGGNLVDTNQAPEKPSSGPDIRGGYIPKSASKTTSFSVKLNNSLKALKQAWFGESDEDNT